MHKTQNPPASSSFTAGAPRRPRLEGPASSSSLPASAEEHGTCRYFLSRARGCCGYCCVSCPHAHICMQGQHPGQRNACCSRTAGTPLRTVAPSSPPRRQLLLLPLLVLPLLLCCVLVGLWVVVLFILIHRRCGTEGRPWPPALKCNGAAAAAAATGCAAGSCATALTLAGAPAPSGGSLLLLLALLAKRLPQLRLLVLVLPQRAAGCCSSAWACHEVGTGHPGAAGSARPWRSRCRRGARAWPAA